ncbi:MAG: sugar ABC transporter ATP-binding protein [Clostridiaceae bacterium]|nr:sugar ABC transporter ATP-binding protein [Clostridiaceae bacterium]
MKREVLGLHNVSYKTAAESILNHVTFSLYEGEVLGIVGINAAGKSTLAKIIAGVLEPTMGQVNSGLADDIESAGSKRPGRIDTDSSGKGSMRLGIGYISEAPDLLANMTVAENLFLGENEYHGIFLNHIKLKKQAQNVLSGFGLDINPSLTAAELTYPQKKLVHIARQLIHPPRVIVIDELTDGFSEKEIDMLYDIIRNVISKGTSVVYTAHNYIEAMRFSDRLLIMRDGVIVAEFKSPYSDKETIRRTVYHTDTPASPHRIYPADTAEENTAQSGVNLTDTGSDDIIFETAAVPVFEVQHLYSQHISNVSFVLNKGEILGVTGFIGSGKTELAKCIGGHIPYYSGGLVLNGKPISCRSPKQAIANKICLCLEDRKEMLLPLSQSIRTNLSMMVLDRISKWSFIKKNREKLLADEYSARFGIGMDGDRRTGELNNAALTKLTIAKCMVINPKLIILDEPTRELDQNGVRDLCSILKEISKSCGVIVVYSKHDALAEICDRNIVLHKGKLIGELERGEATYDKIAQLIETADMKGFEEHD